MKKLCAISMLILGIAGNVFCQKTKAKYDTMTVLEGIRPPIMVNDFARKSDIYFNEEVKKNLNNLVIDFGDKNRLLIDYQGTNKFELKHNVDSLLRNFWQDYSLIRDTLKQNTVKKVTYYGKNQNVNRKAVIDVQYFPQKEVFQFGKEVELVRLQQDTLVLVNFDDKATAILVKTANRVFKTYENQSFLFNLNTIDEVEEILENNINQAIVEASERVENERKTVKPWKILGVVNDLASQKIRSKVKGNALFDFINFHADLGVGTTKNQFIYHTTFAIDFVSSKYLKRGILLGYQYQSNYTSNNSLNASLTLFSGVTFYQRKNSISYLKGGLFIGISPFNYTNTSQKGSNFKLFFWYQLTPLIRIQPELVLFEVNRTTKKATFYPYNTGFKISFGI